MNNKLTPSELVLKAAITGHMKGVNTSIPGHVVAFDPVTQRAQVQIGVRRVQTDGTTFDPPVIVDVPVSFPGDDFVLEFEINPGCEGDIHFSQRNIDGWKQSGGVADNPSARFHHLQDAKFIPGIRSLGNVIQDFSNDGIRMRDKSGTRHVWLKNDETLHVSNGKSSTVHGADGSVTTHNSGGYHTLLPDGTVDINGVKITPDGQITVPAGGGITGANGVSYDTHRHDETGTITGEPRE